MMAYEQGSSKTEFIFKYNEAITGLDGFNYENVITNSSEMHFQIIPWCSSTSSDGLCLYASFISNYKRDRCSVVRVGFTLRKIKSYSKIEWLSVNHITDSFDQKDLNIDIQNVKIGGNYFYCSVSASKYYYGTQIVKLKVGQRENFSGTSSKLEEKNYKTDNYDGDIAYYNTNFGPNSNTQDVIPVFLGDPSNSDIIAIDCSNSKMQVKDYIINTYLYKTKTINDVINITNVSDINATTVTNE